MPVYAYDFLFQLYNCYRYNSGKNQTIYLTTVTTTLITARRKKCYGKHCFIPLYKDMRRYMCVYNFLPICFSLLSVFSFSLASVLSEDNIFFCLFGYLYIVKLQLTNYMCCRWAFIIHNNNWCKQLCMNGMPSNFCSTYWSLANKFKGQRSITIQKHTNYIVPHELLFMISQYSLISQFHFVHFTIITNLLKKNLLCRITTIWETNLLHMKSNNWKHCLLQSFYSSGAFLYCWLEPVVKLRLTDSQSTFQTWIWNIVE